jgi:Raf kinase inhibitor-like YbhB/YbcL family protein
MKLTSPSFNHQELMPSILTCDGKSISPQLEWEDVPPGTKSLALVMDDPDAPSGTFVHWVVFDIQASIHALEENIPWEPNIQNGAKQGVNSLNKIGYTGPCPPSGTHRYVFKLYALDDFPGLEPGIHKADLLSAMQEHILEQTQLIGLYKRSR